MDIMALFYVVVYFTIGWFLSDWLNPDGNDELAVFLFVFWPLLIVILLIVLVMGLAMLISVLVSKLMNIFSVEDREKQDKGDDIDGSV